MTITWASAGGPKGDKGEKGDKGDPGLKGDTGEKGDQGLKGDKGTTGDTGLKGDQGQTGTAGRTILYGTTAPSNSLGVDGDGYVDTAAGKLYAPKSAGAWPAGVSLIGPQGQTGPAGAAMLTGTGAPSNALGADGQHYLDQVDHVTYGPKSGGVWPPGVSLVGPQGPPGSGSPPATTTAQGAVKMSVAPASTGDPIAAGDNDPRLSDARTPTAHKTSHASGGSDPIAPADIGAAAATHTHAQSQITGLTAALEGKADLVGGVLPTSQLPTLAINDTFPVANQAAMLALTAQRGDMAVRADTDRTWVLYAEPASTLSNWLELPVGARVQSINGQTGIVVLGYADVGAAAANDPRLTNARTPTAHKASHATGGSDPIAPADIGAIATSARGTAGGVAGLDSDSRIAATALPLLVSRVETNTAVTAAVSDHGTVIEFNTTAAATYTIPTGLPKGWYVELYQLGSFPVTVAAGSGISTPEERENKVKTAGQKSTITARMRTTTAVVVSGDVAA